MEHARACPPPPEGKPAFWWVVRSEPWKPVEIDTARKSQPADRACGAGETEIKTDGRG